MGVGCSYEGGGGGVGFAALEGGEEEGRFLGRFGRRGGPVAQCDGVQVQQGLPPRAGY